VTDAASLDLYWIPVGAGERVTPVAVWAFESVMATAQRRPREQLFHSAMVAEVDGVTTMVEMSPEQPGDGASLRGVVAGAPIALAPLGRFRFFRYEVRVWPGGSIPDLHLAVESPVRITEDPEHVRTVLGLVPEAPAPVWGRDELGLGERWNCNSVTAWTLSNAGLVDRAGSPPPGGRAPGWRAGLQAATRA
jgi:hypothetical protein